jgi:Fe-S cluster assembly scaffold protein SufB
MQEARQFAKRFSEWKDMRSQTIDSAQDMIGLPFQFAPQYSDTPTYSLKQVDKSVEVYTLQEALGTDGVGDIFMNLLESSFFPSPRNVFDQEAIRHLDSGLIVYVQPLIDEQGADIEQHIAIESQLPEKSASDILVVIVKTGAKCSLHHEYVGGTTQSLLARTTLFLLEEGARVRYLSCGEYSAGSVVEREVHCVAHASHQIVGRIISPGDTYGLQSTTHLLGHSAHSSTEMVCLGKKDAHMYIGQTIHTAVPDAHGSFRSYLDGESGAHILYASHIDGHKDNKDSTDELWVKECKDAQIDIFESKSHILRHERIVDSPSFVRAAHVFSMQEIQSRLG